MSEVVADLIQEDLLARGLSPGERLPTEHELAAKHSVSRTVVREAGRILDQRGIVDIRPGRGMTVVKPDGSKITSQYAIMLRMNAATFVQLMQARLAVEVGVAALAAANRTERDLADLRATIERASANIDDYEICLSEDLRFHELVCQASGNPFLAMLMNPVNECLRLTYGDARSYLASQPRTLREHTAIVDAIEAQDADAAQEATRAHLGRVVEEQASLVAPVGHGKR